MTDLTEHRSCGRHCVVESSEMQFLATISQQEFQTYKSYIKDLHDFATYDDFVLERDGSFLGLSWAGVNAVQVEAPLRVFERWVERTGAPRSLQSLDDFAMRRWLRANFPTWAVRVASPSAPFAAEEASGYLNIPLYAEAAYADRDLAGQPDQISHRALAGLIAQECLEPSD